MVRLLKLEIKVMDEAGIVEVHMPDGSFWAGQSVEQALSFLRRELAYRTAPYSSIWENRNAN